MGKREQCDCFQLLFEAEGYDGIPEEAIRRTIGMTMYDAMANLTGETDPARIQALTTEYKVRFSDKYMTANTHLYPQTLPTLRTLKESGALCCIVSTKTRSRIGETLRKYQMESLIDLVVGMEDVAQAKPAPDGINAVCRHFGLDKAQCRAMTIEVGMQNSGLASTLALMYFTAAGGIAGAIFSVWHNVSGSLFASYCVGKDEEDQQEEEAGELVGEKNRN